MEIRCFIFAVLFLFGVFPFPSNAAGAIHAEWVEYKHGDVLLEGYLAYDDSVSGKQPGVLVFHEWKGLNDYAKRRATMLAELGYAAFAADMYGKGVRARSHEEAAQLSGVYRKDRALMRERAESALEVLKNHERVDQPRLAAIGYCFGGTTALELARGGYDLKGVVSFHGGLSTTVPAQPGSIKAKILVFHGADDSFVNPEVPGFEEEMRRSGADWRLEKFAGAVHSFTVPEAGSDPSAGVAYNEAADTASWAMMKTFLEVIFKPTVASPEGK